VFEPGYRLRPLSEVSAFIKENHHLPDIPSEAEVKENGVSLGEMQAKLLAKVEELTLHMIQLEQENSQLKQNVRGLEASLAAIANDARDGRMRPQ
jgi:predicted RNase H-like nuclease (RuvC/YqgF family)